MEDPYRGAETATLCFYCGGELSAQARVSFFDDEAGRRAFVCQRSSCLLELEKENRELGTAEEA